MIRHIVSWNFQPHLSDEEKAEVTATLVQRVAALQELVPNTLKAEMVAPLATSTCALALYSEFETEEHLAAYQVHPEHVAVGSIIKANLCDRCCVDIVG